jgi:hypothetical protein
MPVCGPQVPPSLNTDTAQTIGTVTTVYGVAGTVIGLLGKFGGSISLPSWLTFATAPVFSVGLFAAAVVIATVWVIAQTFSDRCSSIAGIPDCFSGIIDKIVPAFSSTTDAIFPYTAMHDRVEVVVGTAYHAELAHNAKYVYCNDTLPSNSPVLIAYYHNAQICAAGAGAVAGAVVGGIVGVLLAAAAWTALGCVSIIFCLFALIIAALIALAAAIAGAVIGSQAAKAATGSAAPKSSGPNAVTLNVGDIVSVQGNLITATFLEGESVYWWTTNTFLAGAWPGSAPFTTADADAAWPIGSDPCRAGPNPPIQ